MSSFLLDQLKSSLGSTYTIERELAGGGMSRVFVADEPRLGRKVVVKVMSSDLAAGISSERFEREIRLAASLQQANIVPVLAAGEISGLLYYTMPFVEGQSLRARLSRAGAFPIGEVVGILRDVARALAYAHERGVVHRDIKPDNVLLSGGTAVVTDFGIAKAIAESRQSSAQPAGTALTAMDTAIGTPEYMAPEQAAADPGVDHRADLYSFGCMAYELLTGQAPFAGRPPQRLLAAHMSEAPRPVAELRPETPEPLASLVMRCLEKEPDARPAGAADLVRAIELVSSGGLAAMPPLLLGGRRPLAHAIGIYAASVLAVAILARAAVLALALPDWVFSGSLIVMALGLPVVLFTGYVQYVTRRAATRTPALTPGGTPAPPSTVATLAIKASPHVSWRRAWMGGAYAFGSFAALVAVFMALRALGIGPAATLLAAGKLGTQERLIVTDFQSSDTSLARVLSEAVRTSLGESRVVSIMPPAAIAAALQRMQRPAASVIDVPLARELALREGVGALVDGEVTEIAGGAGGYVLAVRLLAADSLNVLAAFRASVTEPVQLLGAVDDVTRRLREKIGESLRTVRATPPLDQVTTASFAALQRYAEGARLVDVDGDMLRAIDVLREAIQLDTTFAMAYRKLGIALNNAGRPRVQIDSALGRAYHFRDRLTERERLVTVATYYHLGPGRDRNRAIVAYETTLRLDPHERVAMNNLANIHSGRRELAKAESLYTTAIAGGFASSQNYTNLVRVLFNQGKLDEAEELLADLGRRFPNVRMATVAGGEFQYARGQLDSAEATYRRLLSSSNILLRINAVRGYATMALLRGRPVEVIRLSIEARHQLAALGFPATPLADSLNLAWIDLLVRGDTVGAVRRVESALARFRPESALPEMAQGADPTREMSSELGLASFFAAAGRPDRARAMVARYDAEVRDSVVRRTGAAMRIGALAAIALAEGRYGDARRDFWRSDTTYDGPNGSCGFCVYDGIARTWDGAGVADSAIHYWEAFLRAPYFGRDVIDAFARPFIHRRLGELHERKGDRSRAAEHYLAFVDLWKNAEPELQPRVAEVRRRLARLGDVERQ